MKKKNNLAKLILLFSILINFNVLSQEKEILPYPSGFYETYKDFKNRVSNGQIEFTVGQLKRIISTGYQLKNKQGKRIKKPFAVSNGKRLFVRVRFMKEHFKKKDRGRAFDGNRDYSLAYLFNDNYLYFENYFYSVGTALLGAGVIHLRGVIYIQKTGQFIVLKYSKDLIDFLQTERPELLKKYKFIDKKIQIELVRKIMSDLFSLKKSN